MTLIEVTQTTAQVEGVTRKQLLDRFLRETGLGQYGTVTGIGGGGTTTFDDTTNLKSTQFPTSNWVGGWARISKDAGGASAAPENEHSPITTYDPVTNGRITISPAISAATAIGDEYQLWRFPNPTVVKDFLDQCLKNDIYLPCWSVLSEIPDFDMEQNNTTDWTGVNATVTKVTGTEPVVSGKRWLSVVTTSAGGYARTATFKVEPNKTYIVSAVSLCSSSATTAQLTAWDVTNDVTIDGKTSTRQYPTRIYYTITTPATCNQVQIRLYNVENTVTTYWDEVIFYPAVAHDIALPWWVKNKSQVKGVFELKLNNSIGTNLYDSVLLGEASNKYDIIDNAFGRGQLRLIRQHGPIRGPLFIFGIRNEVAYATDTLDVKRVDENLLFNCLAYKVFDHLQKIPNSGVLDSGWISRQFTSYRTEYFKLLRQQSERLTDIITSQDIDGQFIDSRFQY